MEGWKVRRFKRFCHIPCFQKLPPSRAPQARGEARVTVFEQRSHLGPPAEGRLGPSDDDDDGGGDGDGGNDDGDDDNYLDNDSLMATFQCQQWGGSHIPTSQKVGSG